MFLYEILIHEELNLESIVFIIEKRTIVQQYIMEIQWLMHYNILEYTIYTDEKVIELTYLMDVSEFLDYIRNGYMKICHETGRLQ